MEVLEYIYIEKEKSYPGGPNGQSEKNLPRIHHDLLHSVSLLVGTPLFRPALKGGGHHHVDLPMLTTSCRRRPSDVFALIDGRD